MTDLQLGDALRRRRDERRSWPRLVLVVVSCGAGLLAHAQTRWPDTFETRVEALALIQTLNAELLASRSATVILEHWCRDHRLADDARIVARVVHGVEKAPTREQRARLEIADADVVRYRHVQLRCGSHVLSEADNWYVPDRLTPAMNQLLDTSDTPFGKVVDALEPYRRTYAVTVLWKPLPDGWERTSAGREPSGGANLDIPDALFEHRAVLYTHDHRPFSEVDEVYQRDVLAFPLQSRP